MLTGLGRVIAFDMGGRWDSQWSPDGETSAENHAGNSARLVETLEAPDVDLVGLFWGGLLAARL